MIDNNMYHDVSNDEILNQEIRTVFGSTESIE